MADGPYTLDNLHIDNDLGGANGSRGSQTFKTPGVLPDTVVTTSKDAVADPLAALKILNVGTGAGTYKERVDNTFLFKSIKAGDNVLINVSDDEITINSTLQGGGGGTGVDEFFELTDVPNPAGQNGKVLGLIAGALAWVSQPNPGDIEFTQISDVPHTYSGQGGKYVAVKANEGGLEFVNPPTSGGGGNGNTTRYEATISFGPNNEPTVTDLPAGWTFNIDPDIPSRIVITHNTGKVLYGASILAYQGTTAALTPLGVNPYRVSMEQATLTTQFMINFPTLSNIGGSSNSTGKLYFMF